MKEETVKWITTAGLLVPAAGLAVVSTVQSGIDGTRCLKNTVEPCPATDLLTPDQDVPVKHGGGSMVVVSTLNSRTATTILGPLVYWKTRASAAR
jgi:hypothetical protein